MGASLRTVLGVVFALSVFAPLAADHDSETASQQDIASQQETAAQYQGPDVERFLASARIKSIKNLGRGVTSPQLVTLERDGVTHDAVFKTIDERRPGLTQLRGGVTELNFQDSWQTEIPAYVVDVIIGLGMVPATVERRISNQIGSLQWWVTSMVAEADRAKQQLQPPDKEAWDRQVLKMRLFDALICNTDRHANNILVTADFQLRLIDHSRSFRPEREPRNPELLTRFSRSLLDGLRRLDPQDLRKRAGRYLDGGQMGALIQRRDAILALANRLIAERGEAAVIYP